MKLYTTPTCAPCKRVKLFIQAEGIEATIIDEISKFPKAVRSVPTLEVNGEFTVGDSNIIKKLKETTNA